MISYHFYILLYPLRVSESATGMQEIERALAICQFLEKYNLFCNAHTVDFFVSNHWINVIPPEWRVLEKPPADEFFIFPQETHCSSPGT